MPPAYSALPSPSLKHLVAVNPDSAKETDDQDILPVHLACRNGVSKGVVMTLLHTFPGGIDAVDQKERTPLQKRNIVRWMAV